MAAIQSGLFNATVAGLRFPDTLLVINTWDESRCSSSLIPNTSGMTSTRQVSASAVNSVGIGDDKRSVSKSTSLLACYVPLFSLIKQWDWEGGKGRQADVLLPFFNHVYEDIITYPWHMKSSKALMRAGLQVKG